VGVSELQRTFKLGFGTFLRYITSVTLNRDFGKQRVQSTILKFMSYAKLHIVNHQLYKLFRSFCACSNVLRVVEVTVAASIHPIVLELCD
jgi:hypothetical protein